MAKFSSVYVYKNWKKIYTNIKVLKSISNFSLYLAVVRHGFPIREHRLLILASFNIQCAHASAVRVRSCAGAAWQERASILEQWVK